MDATEGAVLAERATLPLAENMGKQKAGKLVERALAKGGSFIEALGQLEKEVADKAALLGCSPRSAGGLEEEIAVAGCLKHGNCIELTHCAATIPKTPNPLTGACLFQGKRRRPSICSAFAEIAFTPCNGYALIPTVFPSNTP
jgi:hypothetical protein